MQNKFWKYRRFLLCGLIIIVAATLITFGKEDERGLYSIVEEDVIIEGDYIRANEYIQNRGIIIGDLITVSNEITNYGMVEGDIISLASSFKQMGNVKGDLRIAAEDIIIDGEISRNASILSNHILINDNGVIDGSVHAFANTINIKGFIGGDIRGVVGSAIISGNIKGNVLINARRIELEPGALIEGNLIYVSEEEQFIDPQFVQGTIEHRYPSTLGILSQFENFQNRWRALSIVRKIVFLLAYLIIGSITILIFKKPLIRAAAIVEEKSWINIVIGFSILIGVPVAAIILMIMIIGIPISFILLALYGILLYLAKIPVEIWLGHKIYKESPHPVVSFLIGSILIEAILLIPFAGWWASKLVMVAGIGAILIMIKRYYKHENDEIDPISPVH
ncbi:bactofilin family protein [Alkaliphilus peptidifermentans]|uniref:Protein CcmA, bactofilin family n=1 Tax=Alkaliphilus peptidifermentans DSM 18978 TaxID=1120976 RepID=A0A1G5IEY8_9FIRM|nr:polymer-forming cytoskeletal protein [Alkaliphilus peptidifermentans]SCY73978.1 protein CcmA, bactofilin family [Alkaliphilus peptidifermentans DSM 18978]